MSQRILIDADGCPVVNESISAARQFNIPCLILCDTSHHFEREGATTLTFSKGADSVDFALVNLLCPDDIVITQDYGLAAMCLSRNARVISQNGMEYTADNIDGLLMARHAAKKIRNGGGRIKGPAKRTEQQSLIFSSCLLRLLEKQA